MSSSLLEKFYQERIFDERYELKAKLASSKNCLVYKAIDLEDDYHENVILKVFPFNEENKEQVIETVKKEALSLFSIQHKNICKLYDCIQTEDSCYLVLEYFDAIDLRLELSTRTKAYPVTEAIRICLQVLAALKTCHEQGIIHRNINLDNVLVSKDGAVKLCGFSKSHYECVKEQETIHPRYGAFDYLAPEVFSKNVYSRSTDLYAVGVLLYQLITRRLPFNGDMLSRQIINKTEGKYTALSDILPSPPFGFGEILDRALSENPNKRFLSALEFSVELENYLENTYRENALAKKEAVLIREISLEDVGTMDTQEEQHEVEVETFIAAESVRKAPLKSPTKVVFYASIAVSAMIMTTFFKTAMNNESTAEAITKISVQPKSDISESMPEVSEKIVISEKDLLLIELEDQLVEIRNLEKELASDPNLLYKSQASAISKGQLESLDLEKLSILKELRSRRIELLSKKLSNSRI